MSESRQIWLVARRELRERSRSAAFRISIVLTLLVVVASIVVPSLLDDADATRDVGVVGRTPAGLAVAIRAQGDNVGLTARVHRFEDRATAEDAVRDGDIDVLVVGADRLEWRADPAGDLEAVVAGALQLVAIHDRAARAGIATEELRAVLAPVPITSVELGRVAGRSDDDETAAFIMTVLLFMAIATYGAMVMSGVVEEKSSRVVEVLLARTPARALLAGKIAGIGLLGLGQVALTVGVAAVAVAVTDAADVPAVRGSTLAWVLVWFILGYALYATVFGALGALASRPEDAQSAAGPVTVVLVAGYFVSFAAIGSPTSGWAKAVSFLPVTAPLAMPNRVAMGAAAWWEPLGAVLLTVGAIAGLVVLGGRVYAGGVLHLGPTLSLRAAWRGQAGTSPAPGTSRARALGAAGGVVVGVLVAVLSGDVVVGVGVGAAIVAVATRAARRHSG